MAAIYVNDRTGRTYFVGERATLAEAEAVADVYNRDPLSPGQQFWAEDDDPGDGWPTEPFDTDEEA